MSKQTDLVRIVTEVSKECRKQLRILAIQKEITLLDATREVLERAMSKKINQVEHPV